MGGGGGGEGAMAHLTSAIVLCIIINIINLIVTKNSITLISLLTCKSTNLLASI